MSFRTFLKVLAIGICFLLALYFFGLMINKPGIFPTTVGVIGGLLILYMTLAKRRIPEAFIVFIIFGFVAIYALGSFTKVRGFLCLHQVQAASSEAAPIEIAEIETTEPVCSLTFLPDSIAPWCGFIEVSAAKYNVEPELIAAVMLQESGGQPEVISASGAVGLMQVMPSDGIAAGFMCINGPCFASRPSTQELLDPAFNVDYGVRMLAGLIERYGNERDALKAYGPMPEELIRIYGDEYYYADKVRNIKGNL